MVDLSSHGITYEIKLRFQSDNLENCFYMQIGASIIEKSTLFNIVKSMDDTVIKMASIPIFSRSMIRINNIWNH